MGKHTERLELIAIDKLVPYANNARTHSDEQIKKIQASIREFGFVNPVLIDKDCGIIAGHARVEAAKREGLTEVPCVWVEHLTEAQKKAYILADNRLAEDAGWDIELLSVELEELKELDFDIGLTGFGADELSDIFGEEETEVAEDDYEVELPEEPKTKLGDIYQLGRHRLMCGDSTDKATVEKLMNGVKADMVFTDPPYGVDYKGINNDDRSGLFSLLDNAFSNYKEFSREGSSFYCFHSDRCSDIFNEVYRKYCHFSSMIIWKKQSLVLSQTDYQSIHEPCIYGWLDNGTHRFFGDRKQTSVWEIGKESIDGHTTPKPIEFIARALKNSSLEKENVIDLFGGSGSTLIACEQLNRNCYMMELDPKYCDVIIDRWSALTGLEAQLL